MNLLEPDSMVVINPNHPELPGHLTQFRWRMHLSLPYPFPSRDCVSRSVTLLDKPYSFSLHNHYNRVIQTIGSQPSGPVYFRVLLEDKRTPASDYPDCVVFTREELQSLAIFDDLTEYPSHNEAFAGADKKIKACFEWLASFLSSCQRSAPYLTSWLVYPISMFDVGTVYHEVLAFCSTHQSWNSLSSGVAMTPGRQLQLPTFVMIVPQSVDIASPMDAADELLAEASMSLLRGMTRLTVLNSYTAVESLANVVFSKTKIAKLVANNMPQEMAEESVEDERKRHRTEGGFLFHKGMKSASGRSLLEENKQQYDSLLRLQELRHRVAHTGYKPTRTEAQGAHRLCCETAQWLAEAGGYPVKTLLPSATDSFPGYTATSRDAQASPPSKLELVRHLLGAYPSPERPDRVTP
jgi:hypothetical protein